MNFSRERDNFDLLPGVDLEVNVIQAEWAAPAQWKSPQVDAPNFKRSVQPAGRCGQKNRHITHRDRRAHRSNVTKLITLNCVECK
jgi:hypothetical protein